MGIEIWRKHFGNCTTIFLIEFLQVFKTYIAQIAKIFLDSEQSTYLASILDPTQYKTLDFLEYLIFFENFWIIPSKRMRLFKHISTTIPYSFSMTPLTIQFTIHKNSLKSSQTHSFELNEEKLFTIGNNPLLNDLTIDELKNSIQLGLVLVENGLLIRDYGKDFYRSKIKIEKQKFLLDNDMLIKIGKETVIRIKHVSPQSQGIDKKHRAVRTQYKGFEDSLREFYEMQRNDEINFKEIKGLREMKDKKEKQAIYFQNNEEKFLELEIIEGLEKKNTYKLVPNKEKQEFSIGRGEINKPDIHLKDMSVSKKHCKINYDTKCGWIISEVIIH